MTLVLSGSCWSLTKFHKLFSFLCLSQSFLFTINDVSNNQWNDFVTYFGNFNVVTAARVEVDPLIPGREPLLGSHSRHRLGVAGIAQTLLAGECHGGGLGLGNLAQVARLGGGQGGEGGEVGEAELVVGGLRLLEILNSGVGRHRDSSAGVPSTRELLVVAEMGNSFR